MGEGKKEQERAEKQSKVHLQEDKEVNKKAIHPLFFSFLNMVTWVTEFHPHFLLIHVEILDVCDGDLSVLQALSVPVLYHQVMPVTYLAFQ